MTEGEPTNTVVPVAGRGPRFAALPPLALYVHIPWCLKKCPYCDFNSHEARGEAPEREYVAALVADLEQALPSVWGRRVHSVFFGGGTPSLFSPRAIESILDAARARLPLSPDAEITLEANPGTFEAERFVAFRAAGINRLSIGIQSFDDARLAALGRVHDGREARAAVEIALARFDNVNLDLMFALPGQDVAGALADIDTALAFAPAHLSAYQLTIEPNTLFHRRRPVLPDDDLAADIEQAVRERIGAAGYQHYETSAHARPGMRCRHNLNYWRFGDYLGIGAGAHGKISRADGIVREARYRQPREYIEHALAGTPAQKSEDIAFERLPFEFMMNALRLGEGFDSALFVERTGLSLAEVVPALDAAERRGLIERDHLRVRPTERGQRFLNDLLQIFLP